MSFYLFGKLSFKEIETNIDANAFYVMLLENGSVYRVSDF